MVSNLKVKQDQDLHSHLCDDQERNNVTMDFGSLFDCCMQDATTKKVIAVVGATGQQGGGVVKAILDDPKGGFTARALTRDPTKVRVTPCIRI